MFDVGPSELVVIAVVALIVLGPTRLPGLVRKVGRWVGKARAMARDFREQLESEVNVEELNKAAKRTVGLENNPFEPPKPAEPVSTTPTTSAVGAAAAAGTPDGASADALTDAPSAPEPDLTYPYGTPTDTSASSADPYVVRTGDPQPGDDTYSHAHAHGADPQPWTPDWEPVSSTPDSAPVQPPTQSPEQGQLSLYDTPAADDEPPKRDA